MELKHIKVSYFEVDYDDLEAFIDEEYGVNYCIEAEEEVGNDSSLTYMVGDSELYEWDKRTIEEFKNGTSNSCRLQLVLDDLCRRGLIEKGHYLINISY